MTVWILTTEFNLYDQMGEYFVRVWSKKPTYEELLKEEIPPDVVEHVLKGGGRIKWEHQWWNLLEYVT